jgi:hypothetical protein
MDNVMNILNGQINKLLRCHKWIYSYYPDNVFGREYNGVIKFNLPAISYGLKDMEYRTRIATLIRLVAHELSHCDQDVSYYKYERDYAYRNWIERSNELNAICFIIDNINMLKTNLGNFDHTILMPLYESAKLNGTKYVPATKSKLVADIMETYMIDTNKTRYKELDTILLNINNIRYMIKNRGEVIDPNIIYPVIYELNEFKSVKVFNALKDNSTLIVKVQTDEEQRKMEDIAYRIDKKYIC